VAVHAVHVMPFVALQASLVQYQRVRLLCKSVMFTLRLVLTNLLLLLLPFSYYYHSGGSSASSATGTSAAQQQQQQQQQATTTPAAAAVAAAATAASGSAPSTRNAGASVAQRRFNPTEAALRLQALQEQQLLEIAAQERALKERQAQEKKAKAGDASARGNNVHVQYIDVVLLYLLLASRVLCSCGRHCVADRL
jgi:sugar (pentulose or hexulose) kinase